MASTSVVRVLRAPRARVFAALVQAEDVARWRYPAAMSCEVHSWDARPGGTLRVSLTYESPDRTGKTSGATDTYGGRFEELIPDELVVEVDEFETDDPSMRGEMRMTLRLEDVEDGGTRLEATHEGLPDGVRPEDNAAGWQEALSRLAKLVERPR